MVEIDQLNQVAFATLGMIALMLVLAFILKKIKVAAPFNNKKLSLVGTLQIGNKEKVLLLNVEGKKILIGATPTSIQTLWAMDEDGEQQGPQEPQFATALDNLKALKGNQDGFSG